MDIILYIYIKNLYKYIYIYIQLTRVFKEYMQLCILIYIIFQFYTFNWLIFAYSNYTIFQKRYTIVYIQYAKFF